MCLLGEVKEAPEPPPVRSRVRAGDVDDRFQIWWASILKLYGNLNVYGVFLGLPNDVEARRYLVSFKEELDQLTGSRCAILVFSDPEVKCDVVKEYVWENIITDHFKLGRSLNLADFYRVGYSEFPCLLLFRDVKDPAHVVISFKGKTLQEISFLMRGILSKVRDAHLEGEDSLKVLKKEKFVSNIRSFTGKTFEAAIIAATRSYLNPGP